MATGGFGNEAVPIQPHYVCTPPGSIERVDATQPLSPRAPEAGPGFSRGYAASGPNTSAWALLLDATGSADLPLAITFTTDNLDWWEESGDREFVMTVAEVRAWRADAKPRVTAEDAASDDDDRVFRLSDARERIEEYRREVAAGARKPWWQAYRDVRGEPKLGN